MKFLKKLKSFFKPNKEVFFLAISLLAALWAVNIKLTETEISGAKKMEKLRDDIRAERAALETRLDSAVVEIQNHTALRIAEIDLKAAETKLIITKEIEETPRLKDPEQGVTDTMLVAINKARKETE